MKSRIKQGTELVMRITSTRGSSGSVPCGIGKSNLTGTAGMPSADMSGLNAGCGAG